jgi:mannose-6-phosphate isomerase
MVFEQPLHFDPYLRPMVWGGRRLAEMLGKSLPSDEPYGEAWEVSDHASHSSRVSRGPLAGQTLRDLMRRWRGPLLGQAAERHSTFPLLVKLLDANDWLSVQVHPDDEAVRTLWPGEGGKTEVWFILDARPGSRVYAGLKLGVDERALRQALAEGSVAECLHSFEPWPGDCLFLKAGTVHAVGGGVLMAEVQQTSDATFRLFDWNRRDAQGRSRPLHIDQALACIDWSQGPVEPIRVPEYAADPAGPLLRRSLVRCPYFELDFLRSAESFDCGGTGRTQILTVVRGGGRLRIGGASEELRTGQTWLLPASLPAVCFEPRPGVALLQSSLPV